MLVKYSKYVPTSSHIGESTEVNKLGQQHCSENSVTVYYGLQAFNHEVLGLNRI